jgi:hypothetical protein
VIKVLALDEGKASDSSLSWTSGAKPVNITTYYCKQKLVNCSENEQTPQ